MKLIVEGDSVTVLNATGDTVAMMSEADGTVTISDLDDSVVIAGETSTGSTDRTVTVRDQAFSLIRKYTSDDHSDAERKAANKTIARELFGKASRRNIQRVAAYKASLTRSESA